MLAILFVGGLYIDWQACGGVLNRYYSDLLCTITFSDYSDLFCTNMFSDC